MKTTRLFLTAFFATTMFATTSFAQLKIGTNLSTIDATKNLEVEATNNKKVQISKADGSVVIQNVPVGASTDKVVTIDATGNLHQTDFPVTSVPKLVFFANNTYSIANPQIMTTGIGSRIDFNPISGTGWNATEKAYIIPETGWYDIKAGSRCGVYTGSITLAFKASSLLVSDVFTTTAGSSLARSYVDAGYFTAGTPVYLYIFNAVPCQCYTGFMSVTRLPNP